MHRITVVSDHGVYVQNRSNTLISHRLRTVYTKRVIYGKSRLFMAVLIRPG